MKKTIVFCRFLILIVVLLGFVCNCCSENVKKSVEDENAENNDENENVEPPGENEPEKNDTVPCARRQNTYVHEIKAATPLQYPFVAALMSQQNEYLCCGTVVSQGMILTTASCLKQPINHVLLNVTKDKGDTNAVLLHIVSMDKFPTFDGGEITKDVGIIYTEKHNNTFANKIRISNYASAQTLVDMVALGFGLNADVGKLRELQYVGVEHKPAYDKGDLINGYFDCIDTKVPTCFRDKGGAAIFNNELVGIVVKGDNQCTEEVTAAFSINKDLVKVLPTYVFRNWLDDKIAKNEAKNTATNLTVYPQQPIGRDQPMSLKSANFGTKCKPVVSSVVLSATLTIAVIAYYVGF